MERCGKVSEECIGVRIRGCCVRAVWGGVMEQWLRISRVWNAWEMRQVGMIQQGIEEAQSESAEARSPL